MKISAGNKNFNKGYWEEIHLAKTPRGKKFDQFRFSLSKILLGFNSACFVLSSSVVGPAGGWLDGEDAMEPMIKETIVFSWQPHPLLTPYILFSTLLLHKGAVACT